MSDRQNVYPQIDYPFRLEQHNTNSCICIVYSSNWIIICLLNDTTALSTLSEECIYYTGHLKHIYTTLILCILYIKLCLCETEAYKVLYIFCRINKISVLEKCKMLLAWNRSTWMCHCMYKQNIHHMHTRNVIHIASSQHHHYHQHWHRSNICINTNLKYINKVLHMLQI